jgi:cytoplasmic iron level regulating protein YaaA (DUF328/UPF0246 family)
VLILLPPSEGKSTPRRGRSLDLSQLGFPSLLGPREELVSALVELCRGDPVGAAAARGLGPPQADQVERNAALLTAPTARADRIYTGVLYDALDLGSLDGAARGRATRWLLVMSSLFGAVRPQDRIPAYRLSGDTVLPGHGSVSRYWRSHLDAVLTDAAGNGLVVDLRSSTYASFWRPGPSIAPRVATVRVLHEVAGRRQVVSHFNKATKGRLVRDLLVDGGAPKSPTDLADHLDHLGWTVERQQATQLDVVVNQL